jgi:RHS repeat-associated protein
VYGQTTQTTLSGTPSDNSQQYTGRENDGTGLMYYRARYYAPASSRFISEDPIGWSSGQTNNYAYVGGDPISFVDPDGLQQYPVAPGTYLPRGPAITAPPKIYERTGVATPRSLMNQFTNMPNPSQNIPGAYVGVNFPWRPQDLPIIPRPGQPYCRTVCPDTNTSCGLPPHLGTPSLFKPGCYFLCHDTVVSS